MVTWRVTKKGVNSKILYTMISQFIEEGLVDVGVVWNSDIHRESFVELIEEWLEEHATAGKIEQWKVVCDNRNNKTKDMDDGFYMFEVYYKQSSCFNTTHIRYEVEERKKSAKRL